ncbi:hypothetical protein [Bradyrhizobium sp.]|uniref:hypothetical protein n=1 Tax=Bradyrhizobium sp. TaxID=376 RepID=UPI001EB66FAB|nr:hypothetical protein [Bradyrhizobium sp.]MBV9984199.1 hypothetical protein [Bradyrhizobium sp.]
MRKGRSGNPCVLASALILASCGGPKALALPTQPVDRAATCGVVATASARRATADIQAPLPIAAEGHILHYALLGASADGRFSSETAGAIVKRMPALEPEITQGQWQTLIPACQAAFPEAEKSDVTLPAVKLDAQLGCGALAQFTASALEPAKSHYARELAEYRRLRGTISDRVGPALRARAGSDMAAQREAEAEAMAKIVRAGPPVAVLAECGRRFGR